MSQVARNIQNLRGLKLTGMAEVYDHQASQPTSQDLSFDDRLAILIDREMSARDTRKVMRLIKAAKFPEKAVLEDLDDREERELDKRLISALATCEWLLRQLNLIILGPSGNGKTWLATAFGTQACRLGYSVAYYRMSDFAQEVSLAILDGTLPTLKGKLYRVNLLFLDDFGIGELTNHVAGVLLDVIDRRQHTGSVMITSQFPVSKWHSFFPDPTVADALLDRLVHKAHRIHIKGESIRKLRGKKQLERTE